MITGREKEIAILNKKLESAKSEFVAIYGRRRIGKTYLVRNVFGDRFTFRLTGLAQATMQEQLANFNMTIREQYPLTEIKIADNWLDAFQQIRQIAEKIQTKEKNHLY